MIRALGVVILFAVFSGIGNAADKKKTVGDDWWWDEAWWTQGKLEAPKSHALDVRWQTFHNGDVEIRAMVARPKGGGKYPGVLFVHGRRGLDEVVQQSAMRIAARGFVVFAPDLFSGRFIATLPIEHDYRIEDDLDKSLDEFLKSSDIKGRKICTVGVSRGGYLSLKLATTKGRQQKDIACYVAYYPHLQDPNAPEPAQIYQYAPEVDQLAIPVLVFVGEHEQYHRKRSIESSINSLKLNKKPATLVVYPGVGRGFDFRPRDLRTFADDLASKDAAQRAAEFISNALR